MLLPPLTNRATAHTTTIRGSTVHYWDYSPIDPAQAYPTVLAIHGFRGDHHGLLKIVAAMPQVRVIVPDMPGFGQSTPLESALHDVGNYADCVLQLMEQLQLGRETVLLGHSFGSVIASHASAASERPPPALVLVNPICEPALEGSKAFLSKLTGLYYRLCTRLPEPAGLFLLRNPFIVRVMSEFMVHTKESQLRQWIHAEHKRYFSAFASRAVVLQAFEASITGTVRDVAGTLDMPVLLIAADEDDLGSVAGQRQLADSIPNSRLEVLTGVGHLIHYEKPIEAAELTMDFLDSLPDGDAQ